MIVRKVGKDAKIEDRCESGESGVGVSGKVGDSRETGG